MKDMKMSALKAEVGIDVAAVTSQEVDTVKSGYAAPTLVELGSAVKLVQGIGHRSGMDCRYSAYREAGPYGC